jgi:hypothetical protein
MIFVMAFQRFGAFFWVVHFFKRSRYFFSACCACAIVTYLFGLARRCRRSCVSRSAR